MHLVFLLCGSMIVPSPLIDKLRNADVIAVVERESEYVVADRGSLPSGTASYLAGGDSRLETYEVKLRVIDVIQSKHTLPRHIVARYSRLLNTSADWGPAFGRHCIAILRWNGARAAYTPLVVKPFEVTDSPPEGFPRGTWVSVADWGFSGIVFPKSLPHRFPPGSQFTAWFMLRDFKALFPLR